MSKIYTSNGTRYSAPTSCTGEAGRVGGGAARSPICASAPASRARQRSDPPATFGCLDVALRAVLPAHASRCGSTSAAQARLSWELDSVAVELATNPPEAISVRCAMPKGSSHPHSICSRNSTRIGYRPISVLWERERLLAGRPTLSQLRHIAACFPSKQLTAVCRLAHTPLLQSVAPVSRNHRRFDRSQNRTRPKRYFRIGPMGGRHYHS
jgi:hypothetical protein